MINPFPHTTISLCSRQIWKYLIISSETIYISEYRTVELNTLWQKGEIARDEQNLLFPKISSAAEASESVCILEK